MARPELEAFMAAEGLTIDSVFIPFSQSRNAKPKGKDSDGKPRKPWLSLNWKCRLLRTIPHVTTVVMDDIDYSAGTGHCKSPTPKGHTPYDKRCYAACIAKEIETGNPYKWTDTMGPFPMSMAKAPLAKPDPCDVLYSIASDADVLDADSYEDWASNVGYSPDSREGEAIYRTCLAIALKLRNSLGQEALARLREACQDY